jgi:hypothetical protein
MKQQSSKHTNIQHYVRLEMESFTSDLAIARELWRRFPDLVQADKLPVALELGAQDHGIDLYGEYDVVVDFAAPDFKRQLWRYCRNELMEADTKESRCDKDFLRSMGIDPESGVE